jgi:hypothetical protein
MMKIGSQKSLSLVYSQRLRMLRNLAVEDNPHKRIPPYVLYLETKRVTDDFREQMDSIRSSTHGPNIRNHIYAGCVIYKAAAQQDLAIHAEAKQSLDDISTRVEVSICSFISLQTELSLILSATSSESATNGNQ